MFSGKTEELIRRLNRARIAKQNVEIFKPQIDTRYHETDVVSHNETAIPSTPVAHSQNILLMAQGVQVVGIDEAQFFDLELPNVCEQLAAGGSRVIIAGLDKDYLGVPFGPMPNLLAIGDYITKLHAICIYCGKLASFSLRTTKNDDQVLLGEQEDYQAACRSCFYERFNPEDHKQKKRGRAHKSLKRELNLQESTEQKKGRRSLPFF